VAERPAYEVASIDHIDALKTSDGVTWQPVRRRFGIEAFGVNLWSSDDEGGLVIEDHYERDGHEELYLVVRGHAAFTVDEAEVDASAGTLVFVRPGIRRTAKAREPGTAVLALGAKNGEAFEPSGWEWGSIAFALQRAGREAEGRAVMQEGIDRQPEHFAGPYNLACYEMLAGHPDAAVGALRQAFALDPDQTRAYAEKDADLEPLRDDSRFQELLRG
jgi:quercetin dioxygenase-like cupin family protein